DRAAPQAALDRAPTIPGRRVLRRAHHLLDGAGGSAAHGPPRQRRAGRGLHRYQHRAGARRRSGRRPDGAPGMEAGVSGIWPWLAVSLVGGMGALRRVVFDTEVQLQRPGRFPLGTLVVNASGSFALGLLAGLGVGGDTLLVVGGGLIGAYTTFS